MVDGTGMCGSCRVLVGGETNFACVDEAGFDAHEVDFTLLINQLQMCRDEEQLAIEHYEKCEGGGCQCYNDRTCPDITLERGVLTLMKWPWDIPVNRP